MEVKNYNIWNFVNAKTVKKSGFDENYNITDIGEMCESILDELSRNMFSEMM